MRRRSSHRSITRSARPWPTMRLSLRVRKRSRCVRPSARPLTRATRIRRAPSRCSQPVILPRRHLTACCSTACRSRSRCTTPCSPPAWPTVPAWRRASEGADAFCVALLRAIGSVPNAHEIAALFGPSSCSTVSTATLIAAVEAEPLPHADVAAGDLDRVAGALADFADLKSPRKIGHSSRTAELVTADDADRVARCPALLHDIGRSNGIWTSRRACRPPSESAYACTITGRSGSSRDRPRRRARLARPSITSGVTEPASTAASQPPAWIGMPGCSPPADVAMTSERAHRSALLPVGAARALSGDGARNTPAKSGRGVENLTLISPRRRGGWQRPPSPAGPPLVSRASRWSPSRRWRG